jgi:hypothetical protein
VERMGNERGLKNRKRFRRMWCIKVEMVFYEGVSCLSRRCVRLEKN